MKSRTTSPNIALGMLLLVYIFNFVDRQILAILAGPIQDHLGLSDTQMGLLGGIAFALLYSTLGVPARMGCRQDHPQAGLSPFPLGVWERFLPR